MCKMVLKNVLKDFFQRSRRTSDDNLCIFQLDGAACHRAKVITNWLRDHHINILDPLPGNSPDLYPIKNLWSIERVDEQKLQAEAELSDQLWAPIRQKWIAINQDLARKLRTAKVMKKKDQHCKYCLSACIYLPIKAFETLKCLQLFIIISQNH